MKVHQHSSILPPIQSFSSSAPPLPSREEQANREVGQTDITRNQSRVLVAVFLLLIFSIPVVQQIQEWRAGRDAGPGTGVVRMARLPWTAIRDMRQAPVVSAGRKLSRIDRVFRYNSFLLRDIKSFEDDIVAESFLTRNLIPPVQQFLTGVLGAGNEKAYVGRGKWLFYRPDVDYAIGPGFLTDDRLVARAKGGSEWAAAPQPDPLVAIFQFRKQLAERGIALVIVVAPPKPVVCPEQFSARYDAGAPTVHNPSFDQFVREMKDPNLFFKRWEALLAPYRKVPEAKARRAWHWPLTEALRELEAAKDLILSHPVIFLDPAADLVAAKRDMGAPPYLETDTHWSPPAMQRVAVQVKDLVSREVPLPAMTMRYRREAMKVANLGDIAVMIKLPADQKLYGKQEVTIQQVTLGEAQWRPDRHADVLLLGDSFSNIFSSGDMGWGEAAGFAEQISFELGRPLDVIVRNDAGAHATREMLSQELAQGSDRLAGKKLVIWEFAGRELSSGDWRVKSTPMKPGKPRESHFLEIADGGERRVTGVVREASPAPRPGSVTYRDHVVQVHLTDVHADDGQPLDATEALVAIYSMRNQVWTRAARYRPGQKLSLVLRNYGEIDKRQKISSVKSSLLPGDLELETPCWGEELAGADGGTAGTASGKTSGWPELLGVFGVCAGVFLALAIAERRERRGAAKKAAA